jgi:PII-like signaling protein
MESVGNRLCNVYKGAVGWGHVCHVRDCILFEIASSVVVQALDQQHEIQRQVPRCQHRMHAEDVLWKA